MWLFFCGSSPAPGPELQSHSPEVKVGVDFRCSQFDFGALNQAGTARSSDKGFEVAVGQPALCEVDGKGVIRDES